MTEYNPHLKRAILEIVETQLRADDPPETRQTLNRLLVAGYARQEAVERIGGAVVEIIWDMLHEHQAFDLARYRAALEALD